MKNDCIYTSAPHICVYVVHRDKFTFFFSLFVSNLTVDKVSCGSCVQIMECSNIPVTQHKKTEFSPMDWPRI